MLEVESFNQRWQPCLKKKDDEIAADKALNEINMKNAEEEEENEVSKLLRGAVEANPNRYTKVRLSITGPLRPKPWEST